MRIRLSLAAVLVTALVTAALGACGSDSGSKSSSTTTAGADTTAKPAQTASSGAITIENFKFSPNPLSAKVGDSITVTNKDGTNHTMTADDESFDTKEFSTGSKTITVVKAGTVGYHCHVHDYMKGVIQVSA